MAFGGQVGWTLPAGCIYQVQEIDLSLPAATSTWTDTGLVLLPGEYLAVQAWGEAIYIQVAQIGYSYPEGAYGTLNGDGHLYGTRTDDSLYNPANVYAGYPVVSFEYVTRDVSAYGLALFVGTDNPPSIGGGHGASNPLVTPCLRPNRSAAYTAAQMGGSGGRVWAIFNDNGYGDNSGSFNLALRRYADVQPVVRHFDNPNPQWHTVHQWVQVDFPNGYVAGVNIDAACGEFSGGVYFTSVRPRGGCLAQVIAGVLVCTDSSGNELACMASIAGVDIWRIGY